MSSLAIMALIGAILTEAAATISIRMASDGKKSWWIGVGAGYLTSFYLLSLVLKEGVPLGVAYGIWAAVGVAITAVLSRALFKEPLTWVMTAGIFLIALGVFLIEAGSIH